MTTFRAAVRTYSDEPRQAAAKSFTLDQSRDGGWTGRVTLKMKRRDAGSARDVWSAIGEKQLVPGKAVALLLAFGKPKRTVRIWPSVITGFEAVHEDDRWAGELTLCDPLAYLAARPVWGVFREAAPGEIVGGAIALAAGAGDTATLTPVLAQMPVIQVRQQLRPAIETLPYAIAAGEPLGGWLARLLGSLGIAMEIEGTSQRALQITLRDARPRTDPIELQLAEGNTDEPDPVSARQAMLNAIRLSPSTQPRGALLDSQVVGLARRVGPAGPVERVMMGDGLDVDEAELRATHRAEQTSSALASLTIVAAQPGLLPGRPIRFTNQTVLGASRWQVVEVTHLFNERRVRNVAVLAKDGFPLRRAGVHDDGPLTVSAVIDDGQSEHGHMVARDRLGRIPVRFLFGALPAPAGGTPSGSQGDGEDPDTTPAGGNGASPAGWTPELHLPLVEPMAGAHHGLVPAHRQGDLCRVAIHSPTFAEIVGFSYRDNRKLGEDVHEASAGMVVRQQPGDWRGLGFWPDEELGTVFDEDPDDDT